MNNEELILRFYDGDRLAMHSLYMQNIGFIRKLANDTAKRYAPFICSSDTLDDLFQIGTLEFIERLMKREYKPEQGKVLTYVKPYIEGKIRDYIVENSFFYKFSNKEFNLIARCRRLHSRWLSNSEIAKELGISERLVSKCLRYSFMYSTVTDGNERDSYGLDYLEQTRLGVNDQHPDNKVYINGCKEYLGELFEQLPARDRELLGRYYGAFGYENMSDEELGDYMMMSRNAVNKAVHSALGRLKDIYYDGSMLLRWRAAHWMVWDAIGE